MDGAGGNSNFGWVLVIVGLVIAGIGLIWVLAPESAEAGAAPRRYRDREGEQPVLLPHRDVHRDQRCAELRELADPGTEAVIRTG